MATLASRGVLRGHADWVTALASTSEDRSLLISASRDKSAIVWDLSARDDAEDLAGQPRRALRGHAHFVEDVVISSDGQFALTASWDASLRLWDLHTGQTTRRFVGHTSDILSCAFSADNRQIVSGSRDRTIRLWNTLGECKYTITDDCHTAWVSCVRFSPSTSNPLIVSAGWDRQVRVYSLANCRLRHSLVGHTGYLNSVTVSPDGSLCASGGSDGLAILWDLTEGKRLYELDASSGATGSVIINDLCFSPNRYWLCVATTQFIRIYDLESKAVVIELQPDFPPMGKKAQVPYCTSLCWSADGATLFAGYTDSLVRVYAVASA